MNNLQQLVVYIFPVAPISGTTSCGAQKDQAISWVRIAANKEDSSSRVVIPSKE